MCYHSLEIFSENENNETITAQRNPENSQSPTLRKEWGSSTSMQDSFKDHKYTSIFTGELIILAKKVKTEVFWVPLFLLDPGILSLVS